MKQLVGEKVDLTEEQRTRLFDEKLENLKALRTFITDRLQKTAHYAFSVQTLKRDGKKQMKIEVNQDPFYCGSGGGVHRFLDDSKNEKSFRE